ncbi:RNA recognition motif domain-containing protein [Aspergillus undulatus]|uniref:RNA recognition motif domain-containing protein n=1 Tax=Aspergillus undulatus TaxID=1810928 RepID=UPI003CCD98D7
MAEASRSSHSQSWRPRDQRWSGRAFESPNWRTPASQSPAQLQEPRQSTEPDNRPARETSAPQGTSIALEEGRRIYVGNMPYIAKEQDVIGFFERGGYTITKLDISIDPFTGRNPSYCFVEFETKEEADRAMNELTGLDFMRRPLKIKPCTPKQRDNKRDSSGFVFDRWERNDAAQHFKGYTKRRCRLKVLGLPKPTSQYFMNQKLAEFFQGFAVEAISKTICPHYQGKRAPEFPHYAYVDFASASDAAAAVQALDGTIGPWDTKLTFEYADRDWKNKG